MHVNIYTSNYLYICLYNIYIYIYIYVSVHLYIFDRVSFLLFHVLKPPLFTYHKNFRYSLHDIKIGVIYIEYLNLLGWSLNSNVW